MSKANLQLKIGSQNFKVSVAEEEKVAMLAAAKRVDKLLQAIKSKGIVDGERAAIMVALNLANVTPNANGDAGNLDLVEIEATLDEVLKEIEVK